MAGNVDMNYRADDHSIISDKDVMELVWKYFEHHGNQRLTHINFFTVLSSALIVLQFSIITNQEDISLIPAALGIIQCIIAFVFYKIDDRTMFLVKQAEKVMIEIERHYSFSNNEEHINNLKIFTKEVIATKEAKHKSKFCWTKQISHRVSYRILLVLFSIVGIIGSVLGFIYY